MFDFQTIKTPSSRTLTGFFTPWTLLFLFLSVIHLPAQNFETRLIDFEDQSLGATTGIVTDLHGFVWLATLQGLVRYDGSHFVHVSDLIDSLPVSKFPIQELYVDSYNQLWCLRPEESLLRIDLNDFNWKLFDDFQYRYRREFYFQCLEFDAQLYFPHPRGVAKYNRDSDTFDLIEIPGAENGIRCIEHYKSDLILSSWRRIYTYNLETKLIDSITDLSIDRGMFSALGVDSAGCLWSASWYNPERGLVKYNLETEEVVAAYSPTAEGAEFISNTDIWQIECLPQGTYVATNSGGLWFYENISDQFLKIDRNLGYQQNKTDQIRSVHLDAFDRLWMGSSVDVYYEEKSKKPIFQINHESYPDGIPSNNVFTVNVLSTGHIGIGTDQGLTLYDPVSQTYRHKKFPEYNSNNYNNHVNAIFEFEGYIWVGTWSALIKLDHSSLDIVEYYITFSTAGTDHDSNILKFEIGAPLQATSVGDSVLWILNSKREIRQIRGSPNKRDVQIHLLRREGVEYTCTSILHIPKYGLLATSEEQLWKFNASLNAFEVIPLSHDLVEIKQASLSPSGDIYVLFQDQLAKLDISHSPVEVSYLAKQNQYFELDHLQYDRNNCAWLTERSGILRWNLTDNRFLHLDADIFLFSSSINRMINVDKTAMSERDRFFLATNNGVIFLDTDGFNNSKSQPKLVITSITSNDQKISTRPAHTFDHFKLGYRQNNLRFDFSVLNDTESESRNYFYQLNGSEWRAVGNQSFIFLSGLSPGLYDFALKVVTGEGEESMKPYQLSFSITSPWYASTVAIIVYILLIGAMIYFLYLQRLKMAINAREAEKIKELDEFKNRFFTNITHELRTPLTVISGMADKIRFSPADWSERGSILIKKNSNTLLRLINQILDLRKVEQGLIPQHVVYEDVINYIKYLITSYYSLAQSNNLELRFKAYPRQFMMEYDPEHLEAIISNLLSNAIKYSKEGVIAVTVTIKDDGVLKQLQIIVADNGIGISEKNIHRIFDRYFRVEDSSDTVGSGIGLALTKEYVEQLGGTIQVESRAGEGSTFTVNLPVKSDTSTATVANSKTSEEIKRLEDEKLKSRSTSILVVEDNDDVSEYIMACLETEYECQRARNGQQGFELAKEIIPDVILTDIMMPVKDGFAMLEDIREDVNTNHIPIIMLTAKASDESRLVGIEQGADAYLTKPFSERELKAYIKQLLARRDSLKVRLTSGASSRPENAEAQRNELYIQSLKSLITENIQEPSFGVAELASLVHLSSRQLSRKLKAISSYSPNQLIRTTRVEMAQQMLQSTAYSISEIAFSTGFSSAQYFASVFKAETGLTPSEYLDQ